MTTAKKTLATGNDRAEVDATAMNQIVGYRLRRAQLYIFQQFNERFAHIDLRPSEYSTLVLIAENPGRKQGEIAAALAIKRANFVTLIKGLADRGLVERRPTPRDKRANTLFLSKAGKALLAEAQQVQEQFERDCVERLGGTTARDHLFDLLESLTFSAR